MTSFSMLVHFFESTEPLNVIIINIENKFILDNFVWANSRRGETVRKCRRAKITQDENYPVHSSKTAKVNLNNN